MNSSSGVLEHSCAVPQSPLTLIGSEVIQAQKEGLAELIAGALRGEKTQSAEVGYFILDGF